MRQDKESMIHELLVANYDKYYRIAYSYVGNESDALDVVQEGAYKAIYHSDKLKQAAYADTWICRIMINEALALWRRKKREYPDTMEHMEQKETEEAKEETNEDLKEILSTLSEKERAVVILRYFEEMSLEEVADAVGEKLSTVKSRLYRALGKMKGNLTEQKGAGV